MMPESRVPVSHSERRGSGGFGPFARGGRAGVGPGTLLSAAGRRGSRSPAIGGGTPGGNPPGIEKG